MKKLYLIGLILLCGWGSARAQAPQGFSYQAVARDLSGQMLPNQSVSFRFTLLQGSLTGTVVYSETQAALTNDYGLASLTIGSGAVVSGVFGTIDWSARATRASAATAAQRCRAWENLAVTSRKDAAAIRAATGISSRLNRAG